MKIRWPVMILALFWLAIAAWVLNAKAPAAVSGVVRVDWAANLKGLPGVYHAKNP